MSKRIRSVFTGKKRNAHASFGLRVRGLKAIASFVALPLLLFSLLALTQSSNTANSSPLSAAMHPNMRIRDTDYSLNWAGYAVTGSPNTLTSTSGSFTVPSLSCSKKQTYAAFWAGLDGYNDNTVEQAGVLAQCYNGKAYYRAWTEFYPAMPTYASWNPSPGDKVSVTATCTSSGACTATVTDGSQSYSNNAVVSGAQLASAECIAERPSSGVSLLPLANFGVAKYGYDNTYISGTCDVTFSNGTTEAFGSTTHNYQIDMLSFSGKMLASTSSLSSDGSSFSVTYASTFSPLK